MGRELWRWGRDTEFVLNGVPTAGLLVWLPEARLRWLRRPTFFGPTAEERAEIERLAEQLGVEIE
ncbi:MAG: hypothetical protein WAL26_24565, partial [Mycobacterium sp.]